MFKIWVLGEEAEVYRVEEISDILDVHRLKDLAAFVVDHVRKGTELSVEIDTSDGYHRVYDSTNADNLGTDESPIKQPEEVVVEICVRLTDMWQREYITGWDDEN